MTLFSYPERLLAWRYVRSKRRDGFVSAITIFSVLGIMLGVATLILVTSLMNGIREEMVRNFAGLDGQVTVYALGNRYIPGSDQYRRVIKEIEGVERVRARIEGQVMASSSMRALGAQVFGYSRTSLKQKQRILDHISDGSIRYFGKEPGVIIGERLMQNLGLEVGDSVTLISPEGRQTFVGMVPRIKSYPILGAFNLGQHALDASVILMSYEDAKVYFTIPDHPNGSATALEIETGSMDAAPQVAARIHQALLGEQVRIYDWEQSNAQVFNALAIQRNVMFVILALIILVATFNIISSLIMLVQDKSGDIAILRTMGATRGGVLRIFLLAGMSIGIFGTMLGCGLGLLAAEHIDALQAGVEAITGQKLMVSNIYFLSTLPTKTDITEVSIIVLLSLALSFFATLYPAWKAASVHPAEALRYE